MTKTAGLADVDWRPPILETERLVLRGYEPDDAQAIFAYASDADVTEFVAFNTHTDVRDSQKYLDEKVAEHYRREALVYAVALRANQQVIGDVAVFWRSERHGTMELGYLIAKPHWGNGYVVEAARALLQHAFATTDVFRIFAPVFPDNVKSQRAAEKMGMTRDGVLRSAYNHRGQRRDLVVYSMLRPEFEPPA